MPDSRENTVSIRILERTREALDDEQRRVKKAGGPKLSFAELIATAWEAYTGSDRAPLRSQANFTPDEKKWIDSLLFVLRSGDKGPIEAVKRNLDQFVRVVKLADLHDQGSKRKKGDG